MNRDSDQKTLQPPVLAYESPPQPVAHPSTWLATGLGIAQLFVLGLAGAGAVLLVALVVLVMWYLN